MVVLVAVVAVVVVVVVVVFVVQTVKLQWCIYPYHCTVAPNWGGRTPGSQTPGVSATLGLNVQMDGGRKMLQNCSKLPFIAAKKPTMHSCNCADLSLWRLKCPLTPAMN